MSEREWQQPRWADYEKHRPPRGHHNWDDVVVQTARGNQTAKYKIGMSAEDIKEIEMSFETHGNFMYETKANKRFYIVCERVIGASRGEETKIVKVHYHQSGEVHGYPITEKELISTLKKHNPDELIRFRERTVT